MTPQTTPPDTGTLLADATTFALTAVADSTGECLSRLRPARFTDLTAGRLGVAARPGMRRVNWLANDILTELGCSQFVTGSGRPGEGDPLAAATWLRTRAIGDLYVQFAWDMSYPALLAAVNLGKLAGLRLWLVGDSPYTDRHREVLEPFGPHEWREDDFLTHWQHHATTGHEGITATDDPTPPTVVAPGCGAWPSRLPEDDFTTFRAACRDMLSADEFETVDSHFVAAHRDACAELVPTLTCSEECEDTTALERTVAAWLATRWESTPSLQHFIVTVRATQVAAFGAGQFVQVDFDQLIGTASTTPIRAHRNPETWQRLRAYPHPFRAAACALAAAGMGVDPMSDLTLTAYDPVTGQVVDATGSRFTVEPAARMFLVAQQTMRRLDGARDADRLFGEGRAGSPRILATAIRLARRELGVAAALGAPDRATPDPSRWFRRWGISIQDFA